MPALTIVAKALIKAARAILKAKGLKGAVGMSPEGAKKAAGIVARSGKKAAIQKLIAQGPSRVSLRSIQDILFNESKTLSSEALKRGA